MVDGFGWRFANRGGGRYDVNVNPPDMMCPCCGQSLGVPVRPHGTPWTDEHDALLNQMRRRGLTFKQIARVFNRGETICRLRWALINAPPVDGRRVAAVWEPR